mmetsp:Transcript_8426/g.25323  ORF Transcript_8426/g.25323 Transcript_8426/m.25323 type:complete len:264 (+) Transcript_8426:452-1243(+)
MGRRLWVSAGVPAARARRWHGAGRPHVARHGLADGRATRAAPRGAPGLGFGRRPPRRASREDDTIASSCNAQAAAQEPPVPLGRVAHNEIIGPDDTLSPGASVRALAVAERLGLDHECRACWTDEVTGANPCWDMTLDGVLTDTFAPRSAYWPYQRGVFPGRPRAQQCKSSSTRVERRHAGGRRGRPDRRDRRELRQRVWFRSLAFLGLDRAAGDLRRTCVERHPGDRALLRAQRDGGARPAGPQRHGRQRRRARAPGCTCRE